MRRDFIYVNISSFGVKFLIATNNLKLLNPKFRFFSLEVVEKHLEPILLAKVT